MELTAWRKEGPDSDIVLSSRIRLARNLNKYPFPSLLKENQGKECLEYIKKGFKKADKNLKLIELDNMADNDKEYLSESYLIGPDYFDINNSPKCLFVNKDMSLVIMVNEEDHLRIQSFQPGFQLKEALEKALDFDNMLEKNLDYAYGEHFGYLTSCPTNTGTGLRASVMIHMPALAMVPRQLDTLINSLNKVGVIVRGIHGEGSQGLGHMFQLSNQTTIGQTEEDIVDGLKAVVATCIEQEKNSYVSIRKFGMKLEDKIMRSLAILKSARLIGTGEAIALLSDVRLGINLGIINNIDTYSINSLLINIRPAHLQKQSKKVLSSLDRDIMRAEVIRKVI